MLAHDAGQFLKIGVIDRQDLAANGAFAALAICNQIYHSLSRRAGAARRKMHQHRRGWKCWRRG
jgi:hypothetical protein